MLWTRLARNSLMMVGGRKPHWHLENYLLQVRSRTCGATLTTEIRDLFIWHPSRGGVQFNRITTAPVAEISFVFSPLPSRVVVLFAVALASSLILRISCTRPCRLIIRLIYGGKREITAGHLRLYVVRVCSGVIAPI